MSKDPTSRSHRDALRRVLSRKDRGIHDLADDFLDYSAAHNLEVDWQGNSLCFRPSPEIAWQEVPGLKIPKGIFRMILARVAVLCNARHAHAVSPYGGRAEIVSGVAMFEVDFVNTPDEQRLIVTIGQ